MLKFEHHWSKPIMIIPFHFANDYTGDGMGHYNVEVIQSGKKNTFTVLDSMDTRLSKEDLFYVGDISKSLLGNSKQYIS